MQTQPSKDLPIGLGEALAENVEALQFFCGTKETTRDAITEYILAASSGQEKQTRLSEAVRGMAQNDLSFLPTFH